MNCALCKVEIVLSENKYERFDVWRKKLGYYTTVTCCQKCAMLPDDKLKTKLQAVVDKLDN